ncbi:MAG: PA14 domain-containing protein [Deltaproteobacteria bacterium]|nr:PA14 domain-containing protein [Deltaproteobacteria bacterium]
MKILKLILWISLMTFLAGVGQGLAAEPELHALQPFEISGLTPARALSDDKVLKLGLSTIYIYKFFRHIDEMPVLDPKMTTEKAGNPILFLNHHFGEKELIFDSGVSQGIGIQMNGFLKFSETGEYGMMALSNDGIRVQICGKTILTDPKVHPDRFTPQAVLDIPKPGWYPVMIQYFQRKGTAAVEMHWKLPGKADFSVIPAEAYAHEPISGGSS